MDPSPEPQLAEDEPASGSEAAFQGDAHRTRMKPVCHSERFHPLRSQRLSVSKHTASPANPKTKK